MEYGELFVGRAGELGDVRAGVRRASSGDPCLVWVEGPAGIGKTSLVRRALQSSGGLQVLWARADEAESEFGFSVVEQLVRRVPRDVLDGCPLLAGGLSPEAPVIAVGAELVRMLAAVQGAGPVAVVVDDGQWADEQSVKALRLAARRLFRERVMLVVVLRSEEASLQPGWQALDMESVHRVRLGPLSESEVAEVVRAAGLEELPAAAVHRLSEHSGGHPLYLHALVSNLPEAVLADTSRPLPVPDTLTATIQALLRQLPAESVALAEALAVLGGSVTLVSGAQVAGVADAAQALEPLVVSGLARWTAEEPVSQVFLSHALLRDAIYQTVLPQRRRLLHTAAAAVVDADRAWGHRVAASGHHNEELAGELEAEARRVAASNAVRAATLLQWAAHLSGSRAGQEQRLLLAVHTLMFAGRTARAAAMREEVERCAESAQRESALGGLVFFTGGPVLQAESHMLLACELAEDDETRLGAWQGIGSVYLAQRRFPEAVEFLRKAASLPMPASPSMRNAQSNLVFATGFLQGPKAALTTLNELVEKLPDDPQHVPINLSWCVFLRSTLSLRMGHLTTAARNAKVSVNRIKNGAHVGQSAFPFTDLAELQYLSGSWSEAAVTIRQALDLAEVEEQFVVLPAAHATAAMIAAGQGRWHDADTHLDACRTWAAYFPLFEAHPLMAEAAIAQARDDFTHTTIRDIAISPSLRRVWAFLWLPLEVQALTDTQEATERAHQLLIELQELATATPSLKVAAHWCAGRLAAADGKADTALELFQEGASLPAPPDDIPLHRAFAEQAAGRALLAKGHRQDAVAHLQRAHKRLTTMHATPFTQRVASDLKTAGSQPTNAPQRSLQHLTEREHAVAALAARGYTNREIAQEIFVSTKTVEYHLRHIFTKLNVTSRRQLRTTISS